MRRVYDEELKDLHLHFSEMGMMVNEAIYKSVKAFVNHDKELARTVLENDHIINERELSLETRCIELIALQQPVTSDLRRIVTVIKASSDLERMADHAVSISKSTIRVKGNKRIPQIEADIAAVSEKVKSMVEEAMDAYIQGDEKKAREIADNDKVVDLASQAIYQSCINEMKADPELVLGATDYMLVSRYLERIGDYVTNICEWTVYLQSGRVEELNPHAGD